MAKAFSFSPSQIDALVGALEDEIPVVHNETMGEDADLEPDDEPLTDEDVEDASRLLVTLVRVLEKFDPEHPLVVDMPRPGVAYDFDAALDGEDDDEEDEDEDEAPAGDIASQYRGSRPKAQKAATADVVDGRFEPARTETNTQRGARP